MDYTVLITENKSLIATHSCPIYKGEKNFNYIKFLCPSWLKDTLPTFQAILPDNHTGKIKSCVFEEDLYKDYLVIYVQVIDELTAYAGDVKIWFTFFGQESDFTMKTNVINLPIFDHEGFSSITPDNDISADVASAITELQASISMLKNTKADGLEIDNESNQLILKSGDEIINTIDLPQEIEWSTWT